MKLRRAVRRPGKAGPGKQPGTVGATGVQTVPIDYPRHALRILAESKYELSWRANACHREPWTVDWLEREVRAGDTVYDIGANVGVFSLIAATLLRDEGVVVAFEPGYASYSRLCENIALNGLSSLVVPVPIALSSSSGLQAFTYRSNDPGQSRHEFSAEPWTPSAAPAKKYTQPMVAVTLDDAVSLLRLPPPNLVKLDVDGAELVVLEGGRHILMAPGCRSVFVEIDNSLTDEAVRMLESYGFRLESRHRRKETSQVWYGVFRRAET